MLFALGFMLSVHTMIASRGKTASTEASTLINGDWASLYEDVYNQNLPSFSLSKNIWGLFNYAVFNQGMDGVIISENGWLFTTEEFKKQKNEEDNFYRNIDFIYKVHNFLQEKNIALLIVPVPAKARVYQHHLFPYSYPSYKETHYSRFLEYMRAKGVPYTDSLSAMQNEMAMPAPPRLFLKTDTHWSPYGALMAAKATAKSLNDYDLLQGLENKQYDTLRKGSTLHKGDLTAYVPVTSFLDLPAEETPLYRTSLMTDSAPRVNNMAAALFDEKAPSVTLVGTSFSADERWNFAGFLKEELQTGILNAADEGLGPFETMQNYLLNEAFLQTPPRLILWEVPERYLGFDYRPLSDLNSKEKPAYH